MALCQCGCGLTVKLAPINRSARGWVKGQPMRVVAGHKVPKLGFVPKTSPDERKARSRARAKVYHHAHREECRAKSRAYYETHKEQARATMKAHYLANREKYCARAAAWFLANKEKALARQKVYGLAHRSKRNATTLAYYHAHPDKPRARSRAYNRSHPEQVRAWGRAYQLAHPDKHSAKVAKQRASRRLACPAWADRAEIASVYAAAARLTRDTGTVHHVDHIVPLGGRHVSGLHVAANLQILTADANLRKGNRFQ